MSADREFEKTFGRPWEYGPDREDLTGEPVQNAFVTKASQRVTPLPPPAVANSTQGGYSSGRSHESSWHSSQNSAGGYSYESAQQDWPDDVRDAGTQFLRGTNAAFPGDPDQLFSEGKRVWRVWRPTPASPLRRCEVSAQEAQRQGWMWDEMIWRWYRLSRSDETGQVQKLLMPTLP